MPVLTLSVGILPMSATEWDLQKAVHSGTVTAIAKPEAPRLRRHTVLWMRLRPTANFNDLNSSI
jgi:hypothetical protein